MYASRVIYKEPEIQQTAEGLKMFGLIWRLYAGGIVFFFLLFLIFEEVPFLPALMNAIFWPVGVYRIYLAGS